MHAYMLFEHEYIHIHVLIDALCMLCYSFQLNFINR